MAEFNFLDDEAIADIAFIAKGTTLIELFYSAAMATASLQTDINLLSGEISAQIHIEKSSIEFLLKAFLDEILYFKDAELLFAKDFTINVYELENRLYFEGTLFGSIFDFNIHPMHNDLKAITWHDFRVTKTEEGWECYVLIDI